MTHIIIAHGMELVVFRTVGIVVYGYRESLVVPASTRIHQTAVLSQDENREFKSSLSVSVFKLGCLMYLFRIAISIQFYLYSVNTQHKLT